MTTTTVSPRLKARIAGVFYLLMALTSGIYFFIWGRLVVSGDPAATANNILSHQLLYQVGFAAALLVPATYLVVTALFYDLFRPVNRGLSLLAAFFSLVGCAVQAFSCSFLLAPGVLLRGSHYLGVFKVEQLQALTYMFFKFYVLGYDVSFVFFAFYLLLIGYLVFKSTFLPRILGALTMVGGLSGLTFLLPLFAASVFRYILLADVGEAALVLWLLVMSVNVPKWEALANRPAN
jgi:hypothetical protein